MKMNLNNYHTPRDLFLEFFRKGMNAHESWKDKSDSELQVLFDYWVKEQLEKHEQDTNNTG